MSWNAYLQHPSEEEGTGSIVLSGQDSDTQYFCIDAQGIRNGPTHQPSTVPSSLPTIRPTMSPSSLPSLSPYPTIPPSPRPTSIPSSIPSMTPTPLPTNAPTRLCVEGQYLVGADCVDCPAGSYRNVSMASRGSSDVVFTDACPSCELGRYSDMAGSASCTKCESGKVSMSDFRGCSKFAIYPLSLYPHTVNLPLSNACMCVCIYHLVPLECLS
jgi:hypothetical protein